MRWKKASAEKKRISYYPFGMLHKSANGNVVNGRKHNYGFNGKEENYDFGNNVSTLDFGARLYDPAVGRWFVVDALAGHPNQYDKSPYGYAWNNPIFFIDPDGNCPECPPWYLNDTGSGKPVLTMGLHNITLPTFERSTDGGLGSSIGNVAKAIVNGVSSAFNAAIDGENLGDMTTAGLKETGKLADRVIAGEATVQDGENLVAAGAMMLVRGKVGKATRRTQTAGDKTFKTERAARREAFRKNNVPTSQANNFTRTKVHGKNKNLLGPNGEPTEVINTKDVNGKSVQIEHHSNGHQFKDNNTYENPHYHGPVGEGHISYPKN